MGARVYVGNLSFEVVSSELEEMFSAYGSVKNAQVVTDRGSGRSKGFGFVEMGNATEAAAAITALAGRDFKSRTLTVSEAREREERPGGRGDSGSR